jgi:hypothetical protein
LNTDFIKFINQIKKSCLPVAEPVKSWLKNGIADGQVIFNSISTAFGDDEVINQIKKSCLPVAEPVSKWPSASKPLVLGLLVDNTGHRLHPGA